MIYFRPEKQDIIHIDVGKKNPKKLRTYNVVKNALIIEALQKEMKDQIQLELNQGLQTKAANLKDADKTPAKSEVPQLTSNDVS